MNLEELGLKKAEITKLNNKGFYSVEDIQMFFPRTYYDFSEARALSPELNETFCAVVGNLEKVSTQKTNKTLMLKAAVRDNKTNRKLNVMWIGSYYLKEIISNWENETVIVCGKLTYSEEYHSFHMNNPVVFSRDIEKNLKIYPVYTKMEKISEEWMDKMIKRALEHKVEDTMPLDILTRRKLPSMPEAVFSMHYPKNFKQLENAQKRIIFNTLYDFACSIEKRNLSTSKGSVYNIRSIELVNKYALMLPFKLTKSQKDAFNEMRDMAADGRRVNALIQGDVGSGKTALAFLMMFAMAGSGYQSVLMAPTEILAHQHYEELKKYAEPLGVEVSYLCGSLKKKEKEEVLKKIASGETRLIVGTHSAASENVIYKDLALSVVDEEHRFGVGIEDALFSKSDKGMHTISMSATPIPRTITDVIFSGTTKVYDLERPAGRQEVQTTIFNNDAGIFKFIEKEVSSGRQAYVICPLVEKNAESNALSVEDTYAMYNKYFEAKGITVSYVTGKTKAKEQQEILESFVNNEIKILIATTVIEVGVNNPNVSTIVINNAERFGIAQLHQLRGRVGRGAYKGYCILKSTDTENERLKLLCSTTNGFELAEQDAKLRGPGDILGERQSGESKELELVLKFPNMYRIAQKEAKSRYMVL